MAAQVAVSILPPVTDMITVEHVAEDCHLSLKRAVSGVLNCGEKLKALKAKIGDGWLAAFGEGSGRQRIGDNPFPFNSRTAEKFITIFDRFGGHSMTTTLPPSWGTLYELATLDKREFNAAKDRIKPDMTRAEVKALRKPSAPKPKVNPRLDPEKAYSKASAFLPDMDRKGFGDMGYRCIDLIARVFDEAAERELLRLSERAFEKAMTIRDALALDKTKGAATKKAPPAA